MFMKTETKLKNKLATRHCSSFPSNLDSEAFESEFPKLHRKVQNPKVESLICRNQQGED